MSQIHYLGLDENDVLFVSGSNGFDGMYLFDGEDLKRLIVAENPHHKKINQNNPSMDLNEFIRRHESEQGVNIDESGIRASGAVEDVEESKTTAELALETAQKALEEIQLAVSQNEFSAIEQMVSGLQTQINRLEEKIN